ncbi:hypothetical protein HRR83_008096 [Exophiala dermatitidis]|uniref:Transcription factor domain-containing protein n=2 Tax=Exophiala dermatitidis TaxID=5970 RepID=H6BT72_EXODN|nr:uncharacterized protein HMPREF1120_02492 [Exophiala dermatitidis NIH/UT8656]KAJ4503345.1 hypothetical protein HRR75_008128 [Exophiala dermatitidis]EHY54322.1 hypothetical protein HMPREF1120_02492 [Exophiala dermatitidis NIH/UT8656]KAJ4505018.1 hypothetical protein HRR74_008846 [Exophiala dermatitidis]KAJ4513526.1 hypothetical protein HRR73_005684 [Exophiala dermatitidis]KAJ4535696.1 hypothetical protein HRR77_007644 [Exophiala dermatitidis]
MSGRPGLGSGIQPGLRSRAKAHVMHDHQRKSTHKRGSVWKVTTPDTFGLLSKKEPKQSDSADLSTGVKASGARARMELLELTMRGHHAIVSRTMTNDFHETDKQDAACRHKAPLGPTSGLNLSSLLQRLTIDTQPRGSTQMDIFHALPIMLTPWDETLISRWVNYDRIPWCPINGQSEWIPFIVNNAMLLHTNLYCWGMHFHAKLTEADATTFFKENPRILEHKVTAIHLMNRHLSTTSACNGATAVVATDEILAAVSIMANIELGFQSRDEAARHMQGLETLLHMRGGMHCLSGVGKVGALLQRVISWNDMLCVELFGGTLRFPSQLPLGDGGYGYIASDDAVCHLEPLQPRFAGNLQREVEGLLGEIHAICDETQARPMTTLTPADKLVRHDVLLRLERRLCMATRITSVSASLSRLQRTNAACIDEMWRAVACAALMYVHHHVRDHSLHWPQFPALVTQFHGHYSLSVANTQPGGGSDQPWDLLPASLHLWALAVGSVVSRHETRMINALADACRVRGCVTWAAFSSMLDQCPSLGEPDTVKFKSVWTMVATVLGMSSFFED